MSALGLHHLLPSSVRTGRWLAVLTCYLDDSGKDPQNPVTTIAGYIARDESWRQFEEGVERWFEEYNVRILHAKDLHSTKGDFEDWSKLKKQAFVSRVCQSRNPHVMMGLTMSAVKSTYKMRAEKSNRKRTITPYTFCFNVILDWLLRDIFIGKAVHTEGVALVLEAGHENNGEAEERFYAIREQFDLGNVLSSISFVPKKNCRAIQLADLIAFYSRRDAVAQLKARTEGKEVFEVEVISRIIMEELNHRAFVALDFDNPDDPSPYFEFGRPLP